MDREGSVFKEPNEEYGKYDINRDFTSLICWQNAREVKIFFYKKIVPLLPIEEKYNLDIQIRKAACSSTANISEGYGRYHYQEGLQFYRISRGSTYELKDHLISCSDFNYINSELLHEGLKLIEKAKISINGYIKFVKKQKEGLR
jgi:four helix bundle protein